MKKQSKFHFTMPMPYQLNPKTLIGELEVSGVYYAVDSYDIDKITCKGMDLTELIMHTNIFDPVFEQINHAAASHIEFLHEEKYSKDNYDNLAQAI